MFLAATSCTTNESENDGFEDELNSELEAAEEAESDTTEVAEDGETTEGDTESEDTASTDEAEASEDTETASDDEDSAEDDEFLAEDSESPAAVDADKLGEKDLKNELAKENMASDSTPPPPGGAPAEEVPPSVAVDPFAPQQPVAAAGQADVSQAAVTPAPEAPEVSDGFEVINPPVPQEDLGVSDPLVAEVDPPLPSVKAAQEVVPLSKINKDPFFRNERLMNAVYLVRPNEDLGIISQKIYSEDKTSQLFADNPHLSKGIETGDKVYYNSPKRPDDKKVILTYFEDNKMSPQYYLTRKGDDIKKIGREVLGHEDGCKEIWATNDTLQTQAQLPSGLKIRYWSGSEPKALETTSSSLASSSGAGNEPTSAGSVDKEPPPPQVETLPEIPPSPEPVAMVSEDPSMASSSPPIASDQMPSMPSETAPTVQSADDSVMTVAAIALIAMAALGIIAIQIKNRRTQNSAMPPSLEFTKV